MESNTVNYANKHIKHCKSNNCKWCLVFKNAPLYTGTNCLISNDIQTKDINSKTINAQNINATTLVSDSSKTNKLDVEKIYTKNIYVAGKNILDIVDNSSNKDYITYRANIQYDNHISSIADIALNSIYWGKYQPLEKTSQIVSYFDISKDPEDLTEVLYNPTFKSSDKSTGISITIIAAKFRSLVQGWGIEYITLQKTYAYLPQNVAITINCLWKGPLPKKYQRCYTNQKMYLLFTVNNSNNSNSSNNSNNNLEYITSESQDITILI